MRNLLARVSKGQAEMVAAAIRIICVQPTADTVREASHTAGELLPTIRRFAARASTGQGRRELSTCADGPRHPRPSSPRPRLPTRPRAAVGEDDGAGEVERTADAADLLEALAR